MTTSIGLPGNWVVVAIALIIALVSRFETIGWGYLALCAGLAGLGELIESGLGAVVVVRRGGTRYGVIGSILGGFLGVILGAAVVPPLGSVAFGFLGAFAGAVGGELYKNRQMDSAMRIGFWSFAGRVLASLGKLAVGVGILWVIIAATWPA